MKIKTVLQGVQWVNIGLLVLNILNQWKDLFPGVELPPWVMQLQILLAAVLPGASVAGYSAHRLAYGEAQNPAARTTHEVVKSANEAAASLVASTPAGTQVAVPMVSVDKVPGTL
jgi:hypothetical protein